MSIHRFQQSISISNYSITKHAFKCYTSCHCTYVFSKQSVSNTHLSRFLDLSLNISALNKFHLSRFILFQKLDFSLFALGDNYSILLWGNSFLFNITICVSGGSEGKESACNARDLGSVPGLERSPREGNGYSLLSIPWTEESVWLQCMGSQRVGHN